MCCLGLMKWFKVLAVDSGTHSIQSSLIGGRSFSVSPRQRLISATVFVLTIQHNYYIALQKCM